MKDFKNYIYEAESAYLEYEGGSTCDIEQIWLAALLNDKPIDEFAAFILATTIVNIAKAAGVGLKTAKEIFADTLYEVHKRHMVEKWEKWDIWKSLMEEE